jgi:hypothetical protein
MSSSPNRRLAQRRSVPTTRIWWRVPKRRRGGGASAKAVLTEAAVIEVSSVGAGIVCPTTHLAPVGSLVEVIYGEWRGFVVVRRIDPLPGSTTLLRYGVEYVTTSANTLGTALFELAEPNARVDATGRTPLSWHPPGR